eukprot:2612901-Prymnesium_polylepis.1
MMCCHHAGWLRIFLARGAEHAQLRMLPTTRLQRGVLRGMLCSAKTFAAASPRRAVDTKVTWSSRRYVEI